MSSDCASSRRDFLRSASAFTLASSHVLGANDRINVGLIGVGIMGMGHLQSLFAQSEQTKDIRIVAISDIYTQRKKQAAEAARLGPEAIHHDYRDLLARPDVDAVFIATPDHWHARMATDAMAAGKDVYLQKPMTYTIDEARRLAEAVRQHKRVLQVGSQYVSSPPSRRAREVIEQGEIGELLWAQGAHSKNSILGEWNYHIDAEASPETIDWPKWLGSAPKRPFSAERYFRWRKYWDYSGGIATDLYYHVLGPLMFAMGPQFPTRVSGCGGIYVHKDRQVPDTYASLVEYPTYYINLCGSMANAAPVRLVGKVIYGHKGTLIIGADRLTLELEPAIAGRAAASKNKTWEFKVVDLNRLHTDDFFSCMRSRKAPVLSADFGYQIMAAIELGVESYRQGKMQLFDPVAQKRAATPAPRAIYEGDGKNREPGTA